MPFDEALAARVRMRLMNERGVAEKRMFGGLAFLVNGNMCCGVHRSELIVRLHPAHAERALKEPGARVFDLSGRPMQGWVLVDSNALEDERVLAGWLGLAIVHARSLPPK
jgi:TfoX/Sxy family transcriptional regulator of competence genes